MCSCPERGEADGQVLWLLQQCQPGKPHRLPRPAVSIPVLYRAAITESDPARKAAGPRVALVLI